MRVGVRALALAACGAAPVPSSPPSNASASVAPNPPASALFEHREWIGKDVTIDVVEPLQDLDVSSAAPAGGYNLELPNGTGESVQLVPGKLSPLPALRAPVTVRGVLTARDRDMQLAVSEVRPLALPPPERFKSAADLVAQGDRLDGKRVEVEDHYYVGFEASVLGQEVWLDQYPDLVEHCIPEQHDDTREDAESRVRVVGFAYTKRHSYGHLGMRKALIVAKEITYLGGDCK